MLTPEDLDNIQARQKVASLELEKTIVNAMQTSFDKHLETNHKPLETDIKLAHDRIGGIKRFLVYCSGFVAGITALVLLVLKFG